MRRGRGATLFLSSSLLFTVSSWRLGKLFCTTTVIPLRSATDNFIPQTQAGMSKISSGDLCFQQIQHPKWRCLHLLLVASVISRARGGGRFMCFEELPLEVNVFGRMIRKSMQIGCGCGGVREEHFMNHWRGEDDFYLTSTQAHSSHTKKMIPFCTVSGVMSSALMKSFGVIRPVVTAIVCLILSVATVVCIHDRWKISITYLCENLFLMLRIHFVVVVIVDWYCGIISVHSHKMNRDG